MKLNPDKMEGLLGPLTGGCACGGNSTLSKREQRRSLRRVNCSCLDWISGACLPSKALGMCWLTRCSKGWFQKAGDPNPDIPALGSSLLPGPFAVLLIPLSDLI